MLTNDYHYCTDCAVIIASQPKQHIHAIAIASMCNDCLLEHRPDLQEKLDAMHASVAMPPSRGRVDAQGFLARQRDKTAHGWAA